MRLHAGIACADVFKSPRDVTGRLEGASLYGLVDVDLRSADADLVIYWLTLDPWLPMARLGYPRERVSIGVWRSGRIEAVPHDTTHREWLHRMPSLLGELCLQFPGDPRWLRWEWSDGLERYVTIVHRHLQAEEFWRRKKRWPAEDAPHGDGTHPVGRNTAAQIVARRAS